MNAERERRRDIRFDIIYIDDAPRVETKPLFLMLIYAKARREDMTPDQKKQVRALAATLRQAYGRKG